MSAFPLIAGSEFAWRWVPAERPTFARDLSEDERHVLLEHGTKTPFCGVFKAVSAARASQLRALSSEEPARATRS